MNIQYLIFDILIAYILDLLLGDPHWLPHPVCLIGTMIKKTESFLRRFTQSSSKDRQEVNECAAGAFLMFFVTSLSFLAVFLILKAALLVNNALFHILNIYFIYSALATKCLAIEAGKVYEALEKEGLPAARKKLSMLVARNTENLNEEEIVRGAVETVAENTVDGIISPLFYAFLGSFFGMGAPLVYAFKAISTLDSMVGYMNEKYIYFGRVSAKTDDAANYIPARLSGILIPLGSFICGKSLTKSYRIMLRDRRNHKSPNCAYPEAAMAGALGVRLGGANVYFGRVVEKPTIGDAEKGLEAKDIKDAIRIMLAASGLSAILGVLCYL